MCMIIYIYIHTYIYVYVYVPKGAERFTMPSTVWPTLRLEREAAPPVPPAAEAFVIMFSLCQFMCCFCWLFCYCSFVLLSSLRLMLLWLPGCLISIITIMMMIVIIMMMSISIIIIVSCICLSLGDALAGGHLDLAEALVDLRDYLRVVVCFLSGRNPTTARKSRRSGLLFMFSCVSACWCVYCSFACPRDYVIVDVIVYLCVVQLKYVFMFVVWLCVYMCVVFVYNLYCLFHLCYVCFVVLMCYAHFVVLVCSRVSFLLFCRWPAWRSGPPARRPRCTRRCPTICYTILY